MFSFVCAQLLTRLQRYNIIRPMELYPLFNHKLTTPKIKLQTNNPTSNIQKFKHNRDTIALKMNKCMETSCVSMNVHCCRQSRVCSNFFMQQHKVEVSYVRQDSHRQILAAAEALRLSSQYVATVAYSYSTTRMYLNYVFEGSVFTIFELAKADFF